MSALQTLRQLLFNPAMQLFAPGQSGRKRDQFGTEEWPVCEFLSPGVQVAVAGRRKSRRSRQRKTLESSVIQNLERRLLLTVSALPLSPQNDVVFQGDGAVDTITFSVVDGYLQHNLAARPGFESARDLDSVTAGEQALLLAELGSLSVQDAGTNDRIFFSGSETFALGTAALDVSAGDITVSSGVEVSTSDGVIRLLAAEAILVNSDGAIRTVDGGMQLTANADRSTTDSNVDYFSIHLDGATLSTSGAGSIVLDGSGIHSGNNFSAGIGIEGGTSIESTSQEATAGEIQISGFGADGRQSKHGIISRDAGNSLASAYGDITVTGVGGFRSDGSGVNYWGIYLAGLNISSTGTGPDAAEISIDGTGGAEASQSFGVRLASANVSLSSVDGEIRITGRGGEAPTTSGSSGVVIENIAYIRSTGTGPDAANISIAGTVGTATEPQTSALTAYGVQLTGALTELSTVDGDISIVGSGGLGGIYRHGVNIAAIVSSTGTGEYAGNISVTGQGGTTADGWGAFIAGSWSTVDGDLNITGAGTSSPQRGGNGVHLRDIDLFASTGVGPAAGDISIHGSAANGVGVLLEESNTLLTTVDGDISLSNTDDSGTLLDGFGGITSTGVGEHAGKIVISSKNVAVRNLGTGISSVDGDILISSVADESAGTALVLSNFGVIESTGTGPEAATITLVGNAPDGPSSCHGLKISGSSGTPSVIRSVDGDILMVGTGGDRTDPTDRFSENPGVTIANVTIESAGTTADAAAISIQGTAGDSGRNGHGIVVEEGSISSVVGDVSLTGTMSNGRGVALWNVDVTSTGTGEAAARFTFAGELPYVTGNVNVIDSDFLLENAGALFFGNFTSTGSGRFSVGQSGAGSTRVSGNVTSAFAPITIQGETVQAAGIHSTGVGAEAATIQIGDSGTHRVIVDGDVSTIDGSILIKNRVNPLNTDNGFVSIRQSTIRSTGAGPEAGTITIDGQGSRGSAGVGLTTNGAIESVDGDISIVGSGTEGGDGIELVGFTHIRSTGNGPDAASISLVGVGGNGSTSFAHGIEAVGNNIGVISVIDGDLEIQGTSGAGNINNSNRGVLLHGLSIDSLGTSDSAGHLILSGTSAGGIDRGFVGVYLQEVEITTASGDLLIEGQGGDSAGSGNYGIAAYDTSVLTTGTGPNAGTITLNGTGGGGTSPYGINLAGTTVSSIDGDIILTGQGGSLSDPAPSRSESKGVVLSQNVHIESTGSGEHAALITIHGTGGIGRSLNTGIELYGSNGVITSSYGDIRLSGVAGVGNSRGLNLERWGEIRSTGTGESAATITIDGTGSGSLSGITLQPDLTDYHYAITSIDGDILLQGQSEAGYGVQAYSYIGAYDGTASITSNGWGPDAADIRIIGNDALLEFRDPQLEISTRVGAVEIEGTAITSGQLSIESLGLDSSRTGDITMTATNGSAATGNITTRVADIFVQGHAPAGMNATGVAIGGRIESLLDSADAGTITIVGSSQYANRHGIGFGENGQIITTAGNASLHGTGGPEFGYGIYSPRVTSLGAVKEIAAEITLVGIGNDHGGSGVAIFGGSPESPNLSTVAGDISVTGQAGSGAGNSYRGVYLTSAFIESTGQTKAHAGQISIEGSGGNGNSQLVGVDMRSAASQILSKAGDIRITGTAGIGTGTGGQNYGVQIHNDTLIQSTATDSEAANITIVGSSDSTWGVYLKDGRIESAGSGQIDITAAGPGDGLTDDVFVTGGSILGGPNAAGDIRLTVNSAGLQAPTTIQTSAEFLLTTRTPDTTIGLGSGVGELSFDNDELALFDPGLGRFSVGAETAPVLNVDLGAVSLTAPLTIYADSISDQSGPDISTTSSVTFGNVATPGAPLGRLQVSGDLVFADGNTLSLDIDGDSASDGLTGHDQVSVSGSLFIESGSSLELVTSNGFLPGENQQFVIIDNDGTDPIQGIFDGLPEGAVIENFLGSPLNARISYLGLDGASGNDVVLTTTGLLNPLYDFSVESYSLAEGDTHATTSIVTLHRSDETTIPTSVDVLLSSRTALSGVDFAPEPITVHFAAGETSQVVPIIILGERLVEGDETFSLTLGNFSDYGFPGNTQPTATYTIINDEFAPIANSGGDYTLGEGTSITLDASASSDFEDSNDLLLFEWDLDFVGGVFDVDAVGEQVSFTNPDGPDARFVGLRVTDTEGNASQTGTHITTTNTSPFLPPLPTQTLKAYNYAHLNLPVPFIDPGLLDTHTVEIDYGNGSPAQIVELNNGERGVVLEHLYPVSSGSTQSYTVSITVTDSDGGTSNRSISVVVEDLALTVPDNRPTISFTTYDFTAYESQSYRVYGIGARLNRPFPVRTEIPLDLSLSTATIDRDFNLESTVLAYEANQTFASLQFRTINDTAYEPTAEILALRFPETLEVARIGIDDAFNATILDDGDIRPNLAYSTTSADIREGEQFELSVALSDVAQVDVIVPLQFDQNNPNFSLQSNSVVIPAGSLSGAVTVTVTDDDLSEPESYFVISIGSTDQGFTPNYRYSRFVGTIPANDAILLDFETADVSATEGDVSARIIVTASEPPETDLVLPLTYTSSSADSGGDYTGPASITIPAGQVRATFIIDIGSDGVGEDDETVVITFGDDLTDLVQLAEPAVSARFLIQDDDWAELTFTTNQTEIREDADPVELTIETGGITFADDVTIPISFSSTTFTITNIATPNSDLVVGQVVLKAGDDSVTFTVEPRDDSYFEITERGYLVLGTNGIPGARFGETPAHRIVVKDNDPRVSIETDSSTASEGGIVQFEVTLSAVSNLPARIPFLVSGSAEKEDYQIIQETRSERYAVRSNYVEIQPGQRSAIVRVRLNDDELIEGNESVRVQLKPKVGSAEIANAEIDGAQYAQVLITVDERPRPEISQVRGRQPGSSGYSSTSTWISEGGSFRIHVSMPHAADQSVWVPVSFPYAGGRASSTDYTTSGLSNGWLKIPAFEESAYFYIHTLDDLRIEDGEKIRVTIGQPVVWDYAREKYVSFGTVGDNDYKFVGIRSSDQDTVYCPSGVVYDSLAIANGCVVDASLSSGGPQLDDDWTAGSLGSLQIANGYLGSSEVFLDGNFNGLRDFVDLNGDGLRSDDEPEEPLVTTFSDGSFLISFPAEMDRDGSGVLEADEAQLVAWGGTDPSTGITDRTRLTAPAGSLVVTPLTTLAGKLVNLFGYEPDDAHARVLSGLGLATFEYWRASAISATVAGDVVAAATYPATNIVNNTAIIAGSYLSEISGATPETATDAVYTRMAEMIRAEDSQLRLADPIILSSLIRSAATDLGANASKTDSDSLAAAMEVNAAALSAIPVTADLEFLERVAKLKIVARGALTDDAGLLGRGEITAAELLASYAAANQENLADAAVPGVIEPVRMVVSDASIVEGNDGTRFAEFEVSISSHFTDPVSVDFATDDDTATVADGDYETTSGTLHWIPGGEATQTIRVPVFGDTQPEFDEAFQVILSAASGAIMQRATGSGIILADDDVLFELLGDETESGVRVTVEGDQLFLQQDGETILDARLNKAANFTLSTASGHTTRLLVDALSADEINRGLIIVSSTPDDSLEYRNYLDPDVEHVILNEQDGIFQTAGQQLEYRSLTNVSNERAPRFVVVPEPTLGEPFTAQASVPAQLELQDSMFTWILTKDDATVVTSTDETFSYVPTDPGQYRLRYSVSLNDLSVVSAVQDFNIGPFNEPPVADGGGPYTIGEGGIIVLDGTRSSDQDLPDDSLEYHWDLDGDGVFGETGVDATRGDELGISPLFYATGLAGPDTITIHLRTTDTGDLVDFDTAQIHIANVAPTITAAGSSAAANEAATVSNNGTFSDAGNDPVTLIASVGTVTDNGDGTWSWAWDTSDGPDESQTVTITAMDSDGAATSVDFALMVKNVAPTISATTAAVTVDEDDVAENTGVFFDPGTDTVTLTTSVGTVTANGDGTWSWSWDTSDGPDDSQTVTITATDSDGAATSVDFDLTVKNVAPSAADDSATTDEDSTVVIHVLENDSDPAGPLDTMTIIRVSGGAPGTVITTDGSNVTYDSGGRFDYLAAGESVTDTFTYEVSDGDGGVDTATVSVTINGANDAPVVTGLAVRAAIDSASDDGSLMQRFVVLSGTEDNAVLGQEVVLSGTFDDADLTDGHTVTVDWGDGTTETFDVADVVLNDDERSFAIGHVYSSVGTFDVSVSVSDGTATDSGSHSIGVAQTALLGDILVIAGSEDDDGITITRHRGDKVKVSIRQRHGAACRVSVDLEDIAEIVVLARGGDDLIVVSHAVLLPTVLNAGAGNDAVIGGRGDDVILGGDGEDSLFGRAGDDLILGGSGHDFIKGNEGNDTLVGGDGNDVIAAGSGVDEAHGGNGHDIIRGQDNNDLLFGGSGNDWIDGGAGNDAIHGGDGDDDLWGGDGDDLIFGGAGNDWIDGGDGNDLLIGEDGNDLIFGGSGNDIIDGGDGNDVLSGGAGDDVIDGGAGDDVLFGGPGSDQLDSGLGLDLIFQNFSWFWS